MATDYEEFERQRRAKRAEFHQRMQNDEAARDAAFEALFSARGYVMASRSDFPIGLAPDDEYIDAEVARLNKWVGDPYPQVKNG